MEKRIFYLFPLFILLLFVVCSCKDDNNEPTPPDSSPEITIPSSENLNPVLSQEGGMASISFTTTADWTASLVNTRAESWITVTPSSGSKGKNEITITATTNETYDERNATVVLKCGSDSKNIVVTQKQKDALTVTSSKYEVASKGGNISVEVKANINFKVEVRADWIKQQTEKTRALTTSNLNFTIEPNETGDKREGEIIIKSGELSETIKVYQGFEDFITLTKKDFTIPEEGGNVDIEIKSTLDYEVKMLSDIDWITEIQSRAVSTHTHHYTISPNETYDSREAKIVFYNPKDENVADTVSIYQMYKGAILVARNEYQFGIDGGTLNLMVQTNLEFDIEVSDTWIQQIQPTRALTEYNLSFAISKNTEQKDREGTITVKDKNSDKKQVVTIKQSYVDLEREALIALYKATNGDNWTNNTNWCSDKPISEWYGITIQDDELWIDLRSNNLIGELPKEIGVFNRLTHLYLSFNNIIGSIPEEIGNLEDLKILDLTTCSFEGSIPKSIGNLKKLERLEVSGNHLSGSIPEEIGNLRKLERLDLFKNNLEGNIPRTIGKLENLKYLDLSFNQLSGSIPIEIAGLKKVEILYLQQNNLSGNIPMEIKELKNAKVLELTGNQLSGEIPKGLGELYNLKALSLSSNNLEGEIPEELANLHLLESLDLSVNRLSGFIPFELTECERWDSWNPLLRILPQQHGYTLFVKGSYESTDFSKDGEIVILQTHTKGNGIKVVLMGDLFVDTDMESGGKYEIVMQKAMEAYFSKEPFRSLREYFDVISIKAVSKHNWMSGETALGFIFSPTLWGDHEKCWEYALKAINKNSLDNVQTVVVLNIPTGSAGYCLRSENSIGVVSFGENMDVDFVDFLNHEACGHGFGLFGDDYCYGEEIFIDSDVLAQSHKKGWDANVDCVSDPQKVRWAHFINDSRYANEGIGIFEGALADYKYGIYRATEYSIMRETGFVGGEEPAKSVVDQFNAPMREAIYKRAMKLAYGDSWTYDYEEFVKFDTQGRADWIEAINKANTRSVKLDSRFKQ